MSPFWYWRQETLCTWECVGGEGMWNQSGSNKQFDDMMERPLLIHKSACYKAGGKGMRMFLSFCILWMCMNSARSQLVWKLVQLQLWKWGTMQPYHPSTPSELLMLQCWENPPNDARGLFCWWYCEESVLLRSLGFFIPLTNGSGFNPS